MAGPARQQNSITSLIEQAKHMDEYQNLPINMKKDNISDYSMGMSIILSKDNRSKIDTPLEVTAPKVGQQYINDQSTMSLGLSDINTSKISDGINKRVKNLNNQSGNQQQPSFMKKNRPGLQY